MVFFFDVFHFAGQMVDTIEELVAMTVTNHNKLLIAQSDFSIEVRDLLSENKEPLFSFPTVDRVQCLTHCASGNYIATLEGKQTNQKSDVLIARVYINWETDFVVNECKKCTKYVKRFMRARIAGVVTPSCTKDDEDYLDMIEIPVSYSTATCITCCQKTGRLLIASGSTLYLFQKVYLRGHNGKSPAFIDFVPLAQIFQMSFAPVSVTICENVITANNHKMVSVFRLKRVAGSDEVKPEPTSNENTSIYEDIIPETSLTPKNEVMTKNGAIHINNLITALKSNDETKYFKTLKNILSPNSFPIPVYLKGVNETLTDQKKTPFVILPPRSHCEIKNTKIEDNFVETHSSSKEISVMAESLLALHLCDPDEIIVKTALQVLTRDSPQKPGMDNYYEQFCVGGKQFICLNFLIVIGQEGYLFHLNADKLQDGLQFVTFFHFATQVISATFESCFLHLLTRIGVETYNIPTLRPIVFNEIPVLNKCTEWASVFAFTTFMGVFNFVRSDDCIAVLTTSTEGKKGKESLPWTVYSLKLPKIYDTFKEIEEMCKYLDDNKDTKRYLLTEGYLMMQMALNFHYCITNKDDINQVLEHFKTSTKNLVKLYFESKNLEDTKTGTAIALSSNINPGEIIKEFEKDESYTPHIMYMLKKWIVKNDNAISSTNAEWIIRLLEDNNEISKLTQYLIFNEKICRSDGHRAVPFLKRSLHSTEPPDVHVLFVLCVLYTQQCLQSEAIEILGSLRKQNGDFKKAFIDVAIENWTFLFENVTKNDNELTNFSEFTSVLIENLPHETSEILTKLIKNEIFPLADVVQMLLKQIPCQVSMEKGHLVLQTFLESVFSRKIVTTANDPGVNNCLKILLRSYLTQLRVKVPKNSSSALVIPEPIFGEKLPEYIIYLPVVDSCNYVALRKLQDLIWSKLLTEDAVKEVIDTLPSMEMKLNVLAMLNSFDVAKELVKNNCFSVIFPYAKVCFSGVKKWRDLIILVQNRMAEIKDTERSNAEYEEIFDQILDHLSHTMTPSQLNAVLEPIIPKKDDTYWKHIMKAQQISYAKDVKDLIINTSQQLLNSNSLY
ncbi:uncharacterized protein LOC135845608 [Planococcus citri]|uniref:uncharacterized protein LOC135845608 n=1 Tax=Planococcus citri TaxID=170843 RepID=UPI0031F7FAED